MTVEILSEQNLQLTLQNSSSIAERFRCLFGLKQLNTSLAIDILADQLSTTDDLFSHEVCYCLGQTKNTRSVPVLIRVLDGPYGRMTRHESAEALGAIGCPTAVPTLQKHSRDPDSIIAETCELALDRIAHVASNSYTNKYDCVDPAPAVTGPIEQLERIYTDTNERLFTRYSAMFALRDIDTSESIEILARGLTDSSVLFRHEVCYVFGQMQNPLCAPHLAAVMARKDHEMVRHEAAEALGSIGTREALDILAQYKGDSDKVVRDSCHVGLDMLDDERSGCFNPISTSQSSLY